MIKIEFARYRKRDGRLTHRTTTTESEEKAMVVLDGPQGRFVISYDELVGLELVVSDDVSLMRSDLDIAGAKLKRWEATKR